jgi:WD40 repeat protein
MEKTDVELHPYIGGVAWSHDSQYLAYNNYAKIWVVPFGKWNETRKVPASALDIEKSQHEGTLDISGKARLVWSPDDRQVGFTLEQASKDADHLGALLLATAEVQSGNVSIVSKVPAELLDWSSDNLIAAYKDKKYPYLYNVTTKQWTALPPEVESAVALRFWVPRRAILATLLDGTAVLVDSETLHVTVLPNIRNSLPISSTNDPESAMIGSPDGRYIVWLTEIDPKTTRTPNRIMIYDTVTQKQRVLLEAKMELEQWSGLAWSPDGTKLAFGAYRPTDKNAYFLRIVYLQ